MPGLALQSEALRLRQWIECWPGSAEVPGQSLQYLQSLTLERFCEDCGDVTRADGAKKFGITTLIMCIPDIQDRRGVESIRT